MTIHTLAEELGTLRFANKYTLISSIEAAGYDVTWINKHTPAIAIVDPENYHEEYDVVYSYIDSDRVQIDEVILCDITDEEAE